MEARPRQVALVVVGRHLGARRLEELAVADRAVADADVSPASISSSAGAIARRPATKTSRRFASITAVAPGAPAASAARVETPAAGTSSASASPRAAASPILIPVKLPGPIPTDEAVESRGCAPAWRTSASTSASSVEARETRSPSSSPSPTSALVARSVAVSKARISGITEGYVALDHDSPALLVDVLQPHGRPHRRQPAPAASGHSTKTIASSKYGSRSPHSAWETAVKR